MSRTVTFLRTFALDMRTYRGPNSYNRQTQAGADNADDGDMGKLRLRLPVQNYSA